MILEKKAKRISKKMAFSIILFTITVLLSSSAFATKLLAWNEYNDGTKLEKQYRANVQKLKENPKDLQARYQLMTAMYRKGLHDEAKSQLKYILKYAPSEYEIMQNSIYYKALYLSLEGQSEEAIKAYQKFLTNSPNHGEAWLNLSYLYYSIGQYDEAAKGIQKAEMFLTNSADVPYLSGLLFLQSEKKEAAKAMFEKALKIDSHHQKSIDVLRLLQKGEEK